MAGYTYTGSTQPSLIDLPVTIGATTFTGGSGTLSLTATPPINTFYFIEVKASVGSKVYTKPVSDSTLTIGFTAPGQYGVVLTASGYKPKKINVTVNP